MSLHEVARKLDAARESFVLAVNAGGSIARELDQLLHAAETMTNEWRIAASIPMQCPSCVRRIEMEKSAAIGNHCMCGSLRSSEDPRVSSVHGLRSCRVCRVAYMLVGP